MDIYNTPERTKEHLQKAAELGMHRAINILCDTLLYKSVPGVALACKIVYKDINTLSHSIAKNSIYSKKHMVDLHIMKNNILGGGGRAN
ncbi:MAG: hypothetical protein AAFO15_02060 [Pseudomonadota bacterium]